MVQDHVDNVFSAMNDIQHSPVASTAISNANSECEIYLLAHFGRPACRASSASIMAAPGSFSLGFRTMQFPVAVAIGTIHRGTIAGKLNGQIPATTCRESGKQSRYGLALCAHSV